MTSRGLRRIRIDEATGAPFEPGYLRQAGNNLDMPVIVVVCWHVKRLRVQKVVIGHMPGGTVDTTDQVPRHPRKFAKLARVYIFKSGSMLPRRDPRLIPKTAGIRAPRYKVLSLGHDPLPGCDLLI